MAAFQDGFRMGQSAFQSMLDNRDREARRQREAELHAQTMEKGGLEIDAARRTASRERATQSAMFDLGDYTQGIDRAATNRSLDADFEAADQAALQGLSLPPVRGGSNAANEKSLTKQTAPDFTSPDFQRGLSQRRMAVAQASGNVQDFDKVLGAETARAGSQSDAQMATSIMSDPTGQAATSARQWINQKSSRLSTKVDPKTGITTFAVVKGSEYEEVPVSPADLGKIAIGVSRLNRGDVTGLDLIAAVNKDIAAAAAQDMVLQLDVGKTNNDASFKSNSMRNDNARTGIAAASAGRDRLGRLQTVIGPDGKPTLAEPALEGGKPTLRPVEMNGMSLPIPQEGIKVNQDGSVVQGGKLYVPDPQDPTKYKPANIGPSQLDRLIENKLKGGQGDPAGGGATRGVQVPGRPLFNVPMADLQRMADRPRGVSPDEARMAMEELRRRATEASATPY